MEEFILAMHLCELGQKGEPLPEPLPIQVIILYPVTQTILYPVPMQLVPPSLRRTFLSQQQNGSGTNTPGSVSSVPGVPGVPGVQPGVPGMQGMQGIGSPASFEDKRRENWEAGQAELQKRRESLMEQQKKEKEARERKEKEEKELREKQK